MIRIVLADDHRMVCRGFRRIIEEQPDMAVVGEAVSSDEALDLVADVRPSVLVTDVSMGGQKSGLLLTEHLNESSISCSVVVLTMHDEQEYLRQAMQRGAKGYVLKSSSDNELFAAIRAAARDEVYICRELLDDFVHDAINGVDPTQGVLSPRETEVVALAVKGYSNQDIADQLSVSVKTVESQKGKIMIKLGLSSKPELFDYAVAHGLIKSW